MTQSNSEAGAVPLGPNSFDDLHQRLDGLPVVTRGPERTDTPSRYIIFIGHIKTKIEDESSQVPREATREQESWHEDAKSRDLEEPGRESRKISRINEDDRVSDTRDGAKPDESKSKRDVLPSFERKYGLEKTRGTDVAWSTWGTGSRWFPERSNFSLSSLRSLGVKFLCQPKGPPTTSSALGRNV